jgi:hypothetical protein
MRASTALEGKAMSKKQRDIVERLYTEYYVQDEHGTVDDVNADLFKDAADEMERLRGRRNSHRQRLRHTP